MRSSNGLFLSLLAIVQVVIGQSNLDTATELAAKAYTSFVTQQLTGGATLKAGNDAIFFTPPNTVGVRGGLPVPEAVTNWDLLPTADFLQDPATHGSLFMPTGPKYAEKLNEYVQMVAPYVGHDANNSGISCLSSSMKKILLLLSRPSLTTC